MAYRKNNESDSKSKRPKKSEPAATQLQKRSKGPGSAGDRERKILTRNGVVDGRLGPDRQSAVATALNDLKNQGYTNTSSIQKNILKDSEDLLNDLGFAPVESEELYPHSSIIVEFDKDFSLIKTTNVDTTIKNSKILDPDLDTLTPDYVFAADKFKSEADPFYELDDEITDNIKRMSEQRKVQKNKKLVSVAVKLTKTVRKSKNKMLPKNPVLGAIKK